MPEGAIPDKIRLSAISFLNAVPLNFLIHYRNIPSWLDVTFRTPAQSADALQSGQTDVALLPSIEFQTIPGPEGRALHGDCFPSSSPERGADN